METRDLILADKSFLITDLLAAGVHVNIPLFLCTSQFIPEQTAQTKTIAKAITLLKTFIVLCL